VNFSRNLVLIAIVLSLAFSNLTVYAQHVHSKIGKEVKKDTKSVSNIREGKIDLKKIDKNKDRKVFQDKMHWNVISDEAGKCPLCKMTLKEVTLQEAKNNLKKNGFKVK